jgi:hypothetical protein
VDDPVNPFRSWPTPSPTESQAPDPTEAPDAVAAPEAQDAVAPPEAPDEVAPPEAPDAVAPPEAPDEVVASERDPGTAEATAVAEEPDEAALLDQLESDLAAVETAIASIERIAAESGGGEPAAAEIRAAVSAERFGA